VSGTTHITPGYGRLGMVLTPLACLLATFGVLGLLASQAMAGIAVVLVAERQERRPQSFAPCR
jgi:hypothetical protein